MSTLSSLLSLGAGIAIGAIATAACMSKDDECDCCWDDDEDCVDCPDVSDDEDEGEALEPIEDDEAAE